MRKGSEPQGAKNGSPKKNKKKKKNKEVEKLCKGLQFKSTFCNIFSQTNVISKRKKIEIPDWRQMKVVFKGFKTVKDCLFVCLSFNGKTKHSKVHLFLKFV